MPKRLFDGDKAYKSDKLRAFAERHPQWRAEYAWLKGLVLADGTFEVDPHRVWAEAYSFCGNGIDAKTVEKMLNAFENFGLLERKSDKNGRMWGYWTGCEGCLPVRKERYKYKTGAGELFEKDLVTSDQLASQSPATTYGGLGSGSGSGSGLGTGGGSATQTAATVGSCWEEFNKELASGEKEPAITDKSKPGFIRTGEHNTRNPKRIHRLLAIEWSRVMGKNFYAPYPALYPEEWEMLCDQVSADLLVPAFELWARDQGKYSGRFPTEDFRKVAHEYLQKLYKPAGITKEQIAATELNALHAHCKENPGYEVIDGKLVHMAVKEEEPGPEALFGPETV